jgi:hypothetical protein
MAHLAGPTIPDRLLDLLGAILHEIARLTRTDEPERSIGCELEKIELPASRVTSVVVRQEKNRRAD